MDSEALLTFVTIHQAGGFSGAAEILGRSQPAISRRIALLEDTLRVPVFERASGGVVLSEAGRALLPHAERVLAALRDAESAIAALRTKAAGRVALAAVGTLAGTNLTGVLKRFAADHPSVELAISTANSAGVSDRVRRGEAMIGLRYLADLSPDLVCRQIAAEALVVACAPSHPRAGRRIATFTSLAGERWFAFPNSYERRATFADNIFAQFEARGIGTIAWMPVDSLNAMKRLVEAGFGMALLPASAIADERRRGSLAVIAVADLKAANPVHTVVRRDGYLSPAAQDLIKLLAATPDLAGQSGMARGGRRKGRN